MIHLQPPLEAPFLEGIAEHALSLSRNCGILWLPNGPERVDAGPEPAAKEDAASAHTTAMRDREIHSLYLDSR